MSARASDRPRPAGSGPRGMTLLEALVALALLGVALLSSAAIVTWTDGIERRAGRRAAALDLAASIAERLRVAPYASVQTSEVDLSGEYVPLEDPVVELVVEEDEELQVKRIEVRVRWAGDMPGSLSVPTSIGSIQAYR